MKHVYKTSLFLFTRNLHLPIRSSQHRNPEIIPSSFRIHNNRKTPTELGNTAEPYISQNKRNYNQIMRPPPPAATAQHLIHMSPPFSSGEPEMSSASTSTCNPHTCRWRPYSTSNDFEANAAMVLIILFCALICSLALNAAIRCFLRGDGARTRLPRNRNLPLTQRETEQRKPVPEAAAARMLAAPTMVYTSGMKLAGAEAECAICLSEFVVGEGIQVLAKCNHGFHVQCIQQWLSSHPSCPTCRCSCLSPSPSSGENTHQCVENSSQSQTMPDREP